MTYKTSAWERSKDVYKIKWDLLYIWEVLYSYTVSRGTAGRRVVTRVVTMVDGIMLGG